MYVDRIPADADRIVEMPGAGAGLIGSGDVLLDHGRKRPDPAAFPNIRMLAERVLRAKDIGARSQLGESRRRAGPRRFGLQPVEKAQAHALSVLERAGLVEGRAVEDTPVTIVIARPVEHADVMRIAGAGREEARVDEAAVGPER